MQINPITFSSQTRQSMITPQNQQVVSNPCKTHSALKWRTLGSVVGAASTSLLFDSVKYGFEYAKNQINKTTELAACKPEFLKIEKMFNATRKLNSTVLPAMLIANIGCGLLIDSIINKGHKQLAKDIQTKPRQEILAKNSNIQVTQKGNLYYHSNVGKKIGSAFRAMVSVTNIFLTALFVTKFPVKKLNLLSSCVSGAVAGLMSGAISDFFANKTAKTFADRN